MNNLVVIPREHLGKFYCKECNDYYCPTFSSKEKDIAEKIIEKTGKIILAGCTLEQMEKAFQLAGRSIEPNWEYKVEIKSLSGGNMFITTPEIKTPFCLTIFLSPPVRKK